MNKSGDYAWKQVAYETPLIDISKLGQVFKFDSVSKQVKDYYDLYDPAKGRILGIADREINIKTTWDPAQYNAGSNPNNKTPWAETHLGEVWWDLSKVKWVWYEQDTQEFKTNNWGKTFPGSSIDIYEWIESTLLPSQYNQVSNSQDGPSQNITGTPLHIDDSAYTVVQRYNSIKDNFVDYYYYWVKNRETLPRNSVVERKNTTGYIANLIRNPQGSGIKYLSLILI